MQVSLKKIIYSFQAIIKKLISKLYVSKKRRYTKDEIFNDIKLKKQQKIDEILDKINKKGIENLTNKEKLFLKENS